MFPKSKEEAIILFQLMMNKEWNRNEIISNSVEQIKALVSNNNNHPKKYYELEQRWYSSLDSQPDYSVYDDEYYLSETFACWWVYARRYILDMQKKEAIKEKIYSVADLGCGIGFSTIMLRHLFPKSKVMGTNIKDTKQWEINKRLSKTFEFDINSSVITHVDLVFASEYFEHIERPIDHLEYIVETASPKYIVTANSFTARSIGHFNEYIVDDKKVSNRNLSRLFSLKLIMMGYERTDTKFWNNRPMIWRKKDAKNN